MGIISILASLGILGMSVFRQTVVIEQSFANIVSNLRTAQNLARNNISSQAREAITGNKLTAVVDGYAIVFDDNRNYSLRYCIRQQQFPNDAYNCTGIERDSLKSAEFNDVLIFPQDGATCTGILFKRTTGDISALDASTGVPRDIGTCTLIVRHDSSLGPGDRVITVNLEENNINI